VADCLKQGKRQQGARSQETENKQCVDTPTHKDAIENLKHIERYRQHQHIYAKAECRADRDYLPQA
jgi:hypothetical protein